ncbi:MAG: thiamine diphosphokinase [SAR324 cluster bacterium]|nr:thiamine diphosphokinase [SAR324 cluster bacterium]
MNKGKVALILLDGEKPTRETLQQNWLKSDFRVCADGAAAVCREYGLQPDVILGDLDSLDVEDKTYFSASAIIEMADQDTTDGEKAIQHCIANGFQVIKLFGALGKRVDHTIYNLGLLRKFHYQVEEFSIITNDEILILIGTDKTFSAPPGTKISLLPIFGKVKDVTTSGLTYSLQNKSLELGFYSSISNCFKSDSATVALSSGLLLVVIERQE